MSLIERQVAASAKENAINKKLVQNAYKAVVEAKKFKETSRQPQKIVYGKNSLLDKIITSSLNDSATNKRLEQIAVSAINGQRQSEQTYKPEGVQMLGQMGREKPLEAITKEMIKEYQEQEQQPFMIDGEARKYASSNYQPIMQTPVDISDIKEEIRVLYKNKVATGKTIKDAEDNIKALDDYYKAFIRDINIYGMNAAKKAEKEKLEADKIRLKMEYDKLKNSLDKYDYEINERMRLGKEINRENALIPAKNREEIMKYEQALTQVNRNRLNIQQQPYESDMEYYKRLRETETQKVNPELYQKFALNKTTSELKTKMRNLFNNDSQIEEIIKSLNDNDKFLVNKNFDAIETDFIKKNGFNPSMNTKMAVKEITSFFDSPASKLEALIKRKNVQNLYIPDLSKKREEDALAQQQDAVNKLKAVFKRKKIEPKFSNVLNKYRDMEAQERLKAEKKYLDERDIAVLQEQAREEVKRLKLNRTRESQQERMNELVGQRQAAARRREAAIARQAAEEVAATNIQRIARGNEGRINAALIRNQRRIAARQAAAQQAEAAAAQQAVLKLQSAMRGYKGRQTAKTKRQEEQQQIREAEQLASQMREAATRQREATTARQAALETITAKSYVKKLQSAARKYAKMKEERKERAKARIEQYEPRSTIAQQMTTSSNIDEFPTVGYLATKRIEEIRNKNEKQQALQRLQRYEPVKRDIFVSPPTSPSSLALSMATTIAEQEQARLRKPRSDLGEPRGPYRKKKGKEELTPTPTQAQTRQNTRSQVLQEELNKRGMKNLQDIGRKLQDIEEDNEPMAKTNAPKKGKGIKKPTKRRDKVSPSDKKKDRLRLVISQIKAGNTNPRLIIEVNKLYKDLYDIENAFMMIK